MKSTATKRVLAVVRHALGGIRTYIHYNYPALQDAGYRFSIVAPAGEHLDHLQRELAGWSDIEFVHIAAGDDTRTLAAATRRQLRTGRYNLVHSHGFSAGTATVLANLGIGLPHVFTSHDVIRPAAQFKGPFGALKQSLLGHVLGQADRIIAVTDDALVNHLDCLPALRRRRGRLVTILHGIDTQRFNPAEASGADDLRERCGIPNETFLLGFMGRYMEQKGFLVLAEALDRLLETAPNLPVHLVAVGSGDMLVNYRAWLDQRPNLAGKITFLEFTPNVAPIMRQLDLLVMPSLWEACGLLAMEAMCAGVPLLGTNCIGLREVLQDTPALVVPAGDAEALRAGIEQAMREPRAEAARQFAPEARRRFDVGQAAEKLRAVFDELAC